ncbi:MAG: HD domain-containing protein [Lachnospiraceae bacterium]|nr:HD domain-containing protein [Lachnospiraceae bacterium]
MDFISSKNIFLLIRDTLKLIDRRSMKHGSRTGYIVYKMLQQRGGYEKFEMAELVMLATLHDIGAYKTDDVKTTLQFEAKNYMAHSIYGYLFLKYLSPMEEKSKIVLYHHVDYTQIKELNYTYKEEAAFLGLAEKIDIYREALGEKFDLSLLAKYAGTRYSEAALSLFQQADEKFNIFERIQSNEYEKELDELMDYIMFTNEEKKRYMEMLMYSLGLRSPSKVVDSVTSMCICEELAHRLLMNETETEKLYYGALIHDIGMLAMPEEIVEKNGELTAEEKKLIQKHVEVSEEILKNRLDQDVLNIVTAHHERLDGSGYPKNLKEVSLNLPQKILQVADVVTTLMKGEFYQKNAEPGKIIAYLQKEADEKKLSKQVVDTMVLYYGEIMEKVKVESGQILLLHKKLETQFERVYAKELNK